MASLGRLFGPFVTVFGSTALVTAFLLFSGFLSDFGVYRLLGLPRLTLSVTALIEQGADTLIDSLSLLGAGWRVWVLSAGLVLVVAVWGWHDHPRWRPWARSVPLFRLSRLVLLVLALLLSGGLVERAQSSLNGSHYSAAAVEAALAQAYSGDHFPTPEERELAIQQQTYQLRFITPLNLLAQAESAGAGDQQVSGLPVRQMAQARSAARHLYGWLVLCSLVLCLGIVLCNWWAESLQRWAEAEAAAVAAPVPGATSGTASGAASGAAPEPGPSPASPAAAAVAGAPRQRLLHALARAMGWLGGSAAQPLERLLAPLTMLLALGCLALLPLAHGLLARESLGAETVMVYLDSGAPERKQTRSVAQAAGGAALAAGAGAAGDKDELSSQEPPASLQPGPGARLDCSPQLEALLRVPLQDYREARRDLLQTRASETGEFAAATQALGESIGRLQRAVIESDCADAVGLMWAARPPLGVRAMYPAVAETFQRAFRLVEDAYLVRVGTLLGYPRESSGLSLAESTVPLPLPRGGRTSILELPRAHVEEAVVLPDTERRHLADVQRLLRLNPDSDAAAYDLMLAASGAAQDTLLQFINGQWLHANAAGVGITTLGTMAGPAAIERPQAATRAVQVLAGLLPAAESATWPEKSDAIRRSAISAMHLAKLPYSAHLFIQALRNEPLPADGCGPRSGLQPLPCLSTVPTAAGFVFQDLVAEIQNFQRGAPPRQLLQDRDDLVALLVDLIVAPSVRDDVRGAACTALGFGGKFVAPQAVAAKYWRWLQARPVAEMAQSAPVCLGVSTVLGLDRAILRPLLRAVLLGQQGLPVDRDLRVRIRRAALLALADLGMAPEADTLFVLYRQAEDPEVSRFAKLVASQLDAVPAEPLAVRLLGCVADAQLPAPERQHCAAGLMLLDDDYDGDDGVAIALVELLAQRAAPPGDTVCEVVAFLKDKRKSSRLRALPKDHPVLVGCGLR